MNLQSAPIGGKWGLTGERPRSSIAILNVSPQVDCGRFPAKRIVGDSIVVRANVVKPGQDLLYVNLNHRMQTGSPNWVQDPMSFSIDDDSCWAKFQLSELGVCEYFLEAWTDTYATKLRDLKKWAASGEQDITAEVSEILDLLKKSIALASPWDRSFLQDRLKRVESEVNSSPPSISTALEILSDRKLSETVAKNSDKPDYSASKTYSVIVDREVARYSTWYEIFPRSQGTIPGRSGTFKDSEARLEEIKKMGFDILYLAPIHPIGRTNRRGANNTPGSGSDPGSPWAIGNELGGHYSIHPDLGSMEDFESLLSKAQSLGIEIALDLAFQVSPDHPYVKQHPEWFYHRKDGSIRYAENPPKKYYDIYPLYFGGENWKELWQELRNVVLFWIGKGVRIFRVDNPHTKPAAFWEWLIGSVRELHPEVIFFAEAFTRPAGMTLLSKLGFDQSYTYFTWKNTKTELVDFLKEYVISDMNEYYRGNFFVNTPDILHEYLQKGGRPAFKIRLILAATLSSSYGIYNGFELVENTPKEKGSEEYLDSEKYQYKVWDWETPGNIKDFISRVNAIRKENPALHEYTNLRLLNSDSDQILFYGKWTEDKSNSILVAVNLDPFSIHEGMVSVPQKELGLNPSSSYKVKDLITGNVFEWKGESNYVRLDPAVEPAHILQLLR